jgi:hypothetical protein
MFTAQEDWVFDPFNGAGTTTKAAIDLGRNGLGFDIEEKYLKISERRLESPSLVRESQLYIQPVSVKDFVPKASKGKTRHGSGLKSVRND